MPRGPRLDAPGVLQHVMVRGIERRAILRDEAWRVVAWALVPNHAHPLVRPGRQPLAAARRSLLTGYAGAFTRRHQRHGHRFQNRYTSMVVEEDPYLQEPARYIRLNPLRAGLVRDLPGLDRYRWTGHRAVRGRRKRP